VRVLTLAVLAVLVAPAAAPAQTPVKAIPVEGTGTVVASGMWIAESAPYTGTMRGTFSPSRIKPGEPFVYESNMVVSSPGWGSGDRTSGQPGTYACLEAVAPAAELRAPEPAVAGEPAGRGSRLPLRAFRTGLVPPVRVDFRGGSCLAPPPLHAQALEPVRPALVCGHRR
jgi:hypothetical protein